MLAAKDRAQRLWVGARPDPNKPLQRQLVLRIRESRPRIVPWAVLDRRLARWRALQTDPPWPRKIRQRFCEVLQTLESTPKATRWAYFRTILNGWCTARRFQGRRMCPFCRHGEDSLEHFSRCPLVRDVGNKKLNLGLRAEDPLAFFLLSPNKVEKSQCIRHAAYLHALYRLHNSLRTGTCIDCCEDRVWAEVRSVLMNHPCLAINAVV